MFITVRINQKCLAEECRPDLQLAPQIQLNLLLIAKLIDVGYEVVLNKPDVEICNDTK